MKKKSSLVFNQSRYQLSDFSREDIILQLQEKLRGRVEEAYLFGSFASGRHGDNSDIDLLIVTETSQPFVQRPLLFKDLAEIFPDINPLVYTPKEFKNKLGSDNGFWKQVERTMKRIV